MPPVNHLPNQIHHQAKAIFNNLVTIRRDLHQHPEPSGQEAWTAHYIEEQLSDLGLTVHSAVGGHGIYADLITDSAKPTAAIRVDMDALPIQEVNQAPYRSTIPGMMHACGHDVHAAIGVGTAMVLSQQRANLNGNVRFIFQPEEEEITGALRMIRAGVLRNPTPAAIFGLHVAPLLAGQIGWTDDLFLAGFEHHLVTLAPQSGHLSSPGKLDHLARRCCQAIQKFNRFHLPQSWESMQAFWETMQAGDPELKRFIVYEASTNDEEPSIWQGQFGLGIKAANQHLRIAALGRVRAALSTICAATHTRYRIEPMASMLDMRNDPHLVRSNLSALSVSIGSANLVQLKAAFPFNCEDFAYFAQLIPGAMYWLGAANPTQGKYAMLHTPDFDVDESCLLTGTITLAALVTNFLATTSHH